MMNPLKLLRIAAHESENPTELSLRQAFALLQPRLKPPFSFQIPSPSEYTQLNRAIAYGILTEPHLAKTHLTHLHAVVTDGYDFFTSILLKLSSESYPKLLEPSRNQLVWVTSKLIDTSAIGVDSLFISLLRQIRGGDFSEPNLWLSAELLRVSSDKWDWLLDEPLVLTSTLYAYLRLLADHYRLAGDHKLGVLKRMEIDFCIRVLRHHFNLCQQIGRDLIRLLQDLVSIPEFRDVWKDLLFNPATFGVPGFSDISQIYHSRTPSQYFLLRVTFEMESQVRFLLTHVKWGSQKRYQEWFSKKFLQRPEQETVIVDLIRFICCSHHPSNEIIRSNVISRWAVIGWLLKCCRRNYFEASAKLALFYDWLFFDGTLDNIMNIEPAILLMVHSVPQYIDLTHTLMEFLFLLVDNYDCDRKDLIFQGVSMAFRALVTKGVLHSLEPLTTCSVLSSSLRKRLITFLPSSKGEISSEPSVMHSQVVVKRELELSSCHGKTKFGALENLLDSLGTTVRKAEKNGLQV